MFYKCKLFQLKIYFYVISNSMLKALLYIVMRTDESSISTSLIKECCRKIFNLNWCIWVNNIKNVNNSIEWKQLKIVCHPVVETLFFLILLSTIKFDIIQYHRVLDEYWSTLQKKVYINNIFYNITRLSCDSIQAIQSTFSAVEYI